MINRREKIQEYIRSKTEEIIKSEKIDDNGVVAEDISYELKFDRANVSRELNNLWKNGFLIKIAGRPVFYLDTSVISQHYPDVYVPTFIPKESHLSDYLNASNTYTSPYDNELDLEKMIGADGSLSSVIAKAKAAIYYPPYGLHTLITGNSGTEKSTLADSMVEYAIKNGIKNKRCPYYDIDCRRANANIQQFEERLFGYQDENSRENSRKGIMEMCTNGFLLLQNIDYLPQSTTDLISSLLNKGYFTRINSNTQIPVRFMLILISSLPLEDPKLLPYTHYITTLIDLPDMDNRGVYEKLVMIMDCFAREARTMKKPLTVAKDVIACYAFKIYRENITKMENEIRDACSHAYVNTLVGKTQTVEVSLGDLPAEVVNYAKDGLVNKEAQRSAPVLLSILDGDYVTFDSSGQSDSFDYFYYFPKKSAAYLREHYFSDQNHETVSYEELEKNIDRRIAFIRNSNFSQQEEMRKNIDPDIMLITDSILFKDAENIVLKEHQEFLYGLYLHLGALIKKKGGRHDSEQVYEIQSRQSLPKHFRSAEAILKQLESKYHIETSGQEYDYIAVYLEKSLKAVHNSPVSILIIAHGESIASQMLEYAQPFNRHQIRMEAIDFHKDMSLEQCLDLACRKTVSLNQGSGVLIITDQEPLTTIDEYIYDRTKIPCRCIVPLTLNRLCTVLEISGLSLKNLDYLTDSSSRSLLYDTEEDNDFLHQIEESIYPSCSFIDISKAIKTLRHCLRNTLTKLNVAYSRDIATVYYSSCIPMLERVIRNETVQDKKATKFISANKELMKAVSEGLESAGKTFRIHIPQAELAGVARSLMFLLENEGNAET